MMVVKWTVYYTHRWEFEAGGILATRATLGRCIVV